jgi:hypothetical protein
MHASQVRCWLLFHDTVSFPEVKTAIDEFMSKNSHWKKVYEVKFNHGLILLERNY